MRFRITGVLVAAAWGFLPISVAQSAVAPEGMERTYMQNYKDMVFGTCVANAYKEDNKVTADVGSSINALRDWTYYDMEKSPDEVRVLIDKYLARDYRNPLVESEVKNIRFDFLKCLDLYHSKDLSDLAKKLVLKPARTYKKDN